MRSRLPGSLSSGASRKEGPRMFESRELPGKQGYTYMLPLVWGEGASWCWNRIVIRGSQESCNWCINVAHGPKVGPFQTSLSWSYKVSLHKIFMVPEKSTVNVVFCIWTSLTLLCHLFASASWPWLVSIIILLLCNKWIQTWWLIPMHIC